MRILSAISARADSTLAHAINTFKMADGFARLGHEVVLVCRAPADRSFGEEALRARLSLADSLSVVTTRSLPLPFGLDANAGFAWQVAGLMRRTDPEFAYFRHRAAPLKAARMGLAMAVEAHTGPPFKSAAMRKLLEAAGRLPAIRSVVTIAPALADAYAAGGVPREKLLVLPSGVDTALFRQPEGWQRSPRARPRILYSGHMYDYKGVPTIIAAAACLPDCDFIMVGGLPADIAAQQARTAAAGLSNIEFTGMRPYADIPTLLWDADVLLLPPSANHASAQWTSPVKLGEYLASGTPLVASAIPALTRLLTEREAAMFRPDDADDLARAIRAVLDDPAGAAARSTAARALADTWSYTARAAAILKHALGQAG